MNSTRAKDAIKRTFDLVLAVILILLTGPFICLLLLASCIERLVRLDGGPMFIREPRITQGRPFQLIKLNMYKEPHRQRYMHFSPAFFEHHSFSHLQMDPSSLTRIGRVMKKLYLDETAQVINILRNEMSFVGPRPHPIGYPINDLPPRQEQKAGLVSISATRWKNNELVNSDEADRVYLEIYRHGTISRLIKTDVQVLYDAARALIKAKGM